MPVIGATTVNGNAVVAQHPAGGGLRDVDGRNYTAVVGHRLGWGATYEGTGESHGDMWFHIPIPTINVLTLPGVVLPAGGRLFLDNFFVLFEAVDCRVAGIHAWDLRNGFFHAPLPTGVADEGMSGDWGDWGRRVTNDRGQVLTNIWTPREGSGRHMMMAGLGISVFVDFTGTPDSPPRRITFFGAGADWADRAVN